ncbi:MAG: histidine kinase [Acidobacteriia bacterium]|nr:histidine kinase [Terriglobia bacterium]MBV8906771.1 histidine kinase [Terriglobia bacterium]MBV9746331.1 histidine kinase [Terriglobia bacterium]
MGFRIGVPLPRSSRWLWIALIWLSIGMFDASDTVFSMRAEGHHHAWFKLFVTLLLSWLPWALATPAILNLVHRYPLRLQSVAAHLGMCAATGLVFAAWSAALEELLNPWLQIPPPHDFAALTFAKFFNRLVSFVILYASIVAIGCVLDSRQRLALQKTETARLNELLTQAQLAALRSQIEPHFLFNTLNSIAALVRDGKNDAAIQTIAKLGGLLRRTVEGSARHEIALGEEIDFLRDYLDIQKARFAERLRLSIDIPQQLLAAQVPSLVLQPIVENSIKHGIAKRAHGGRIHVAAFRSGGELTLSVYNDGPKLTPNNGTRPAGTGICNIEERLRSLYGTAFSLTIRNENSSGVEVSVSFPFREN